jgi:hypothetical protein
MPNTKMLLHWLAVEGSDGLMNVEPFFLWAGLMGPRFGLHSLLWAPPLHVDWTDSGGAVASTYISIFL